MHSEKPKQLKLRCLLEQENGLYMAYCIDLSLGVQGDSPDEVRDKLHTQIDSYLSKVVEIAKEGDVRGAKQLLSRKAPISIRARYHIVGLKNWWRKRCSTPTKQLWKEEPPYPLAMQ